MAGFNLRSKVLVPVTLMILATIAAALVVVNQVVRRQVLVRVASDLEKSSRTFSELQSREWDLLWERGLVTSEAPHLKAAIDTGDSTTVQHVANKLFETLRTDLLLITDEDGRLLAQKGSSPFSPAALDFDSLQALDQKSVGQFGLLPLAEQVYRVVSLAVTALDVGRAYTLGRLTMGNRIDRAYLAELKNLVKCDVAFRFGDRLKLHTFDDRVSGQLPVVWQSFENDPAGFHAVLGEEEFLAVRAGSYGDYELFQSVDESFRSIMRPIEMTMLVVAGFAIVASILISSFVSRKIVMPVKRLVKATDAITAGDYEHPLETKSTDEIGHLAARFDEMRQSLQQKMTQLRGRNLELEEALAKLNTAQEELVRSEKLAATGKITVQLSHELNNPIHNIQNCLEAARKKIAAGQSGTQFIDLAYDEVLRIGALVKQMLDFYRPQVINQQRTDVHQVMLDVLRSSEKQFKDRGIELVLGLDSQVHEIVTSGDRLKQVFLNLVLNAVDAMPNGGRLTVCSSAGDSTLDVRFQDTGCGIPLENLNKIFDAFFTTKTQASGVGLGLTVSYGIIRSLGGEILVDSKLSKGSAFTIKLPLNNGQTQQANLTPA